MSPEHTLTATLFTVTALVLAASWLATQDWLHALMGAM